MDRQAILRLAQVQLDSESWKMLTEEYGKELNRIDANIKEKLRNGDTNGVFLNEGMRLGIEFCRALPLKLRDDNRNYFDKLYGKIVGDKISA